MFDNNRKILNRQILFVLFAALLGIAFVTQSSLAQPAKPTPTPDEVELSGFKVKSSIEIGGRWRSLDGSEDKFRSDFNYKKGFRIFNSSFSMEDKEGKNRFFDSLLINASGWGGDPTGFTRINIEKSGGYRLTSNVRRITYFNNLNNHALKEHTQNTRNNMGDFDLTVFPENEKLRLNFGYSYSRYTGPGFSTARNYRDDFTTPVINKAVNNDFRAGISTKLLGFNLSFTQGYRNFSDKTNYLLSAPNVGNNTTDTTVYNSFSRLMPVRGEAYFSIFDAHRTFAKKVDLTARLIYSSTSTQSGVFDIYTGRDNSNNFVDLDRYNIEGKAKRPQTRGDLGVSWRITDDFTISNTFSFDQFAVNGGEDFLQSFALRNASGITQPTRITTSTAYRVNAFKKYTNLVEGDYQFTNRVGLHLGYRYTHRKVNVTGYDLNIVSSNVVQAVTNPSRLCARAGVNPLVPCEEEKNSTHTVIAGMKIKPTNWWVLFWDVEKGSADNVFTRIENYKFTNFRVRNRLTFDKFVFSFSGVSKDNTNPAQTDNVPPRGFGPVVKSRIYSGNLDWNPIPELGFSGGYTYTHQTAETPIYINRSFPPSTALVRVLGRSEYYVRDHYANFDVVVNPIKRLSIYGSYRISKDTGQGNRSLGDPYTILIGNSTTSLVNPQNIVNSYPYQLQSPEVRAAIRLTKNIDWNIGYQYYNYKEKFQSVQNYRAHLPYTSFTIYFGGADR